MVRFCRSIKMRVDSFEMCERSGFSCHAEIVASAPSCCIMFLPCYEPSSGYSSSCSPYPFSAFRSRLLSTLLPARRTSLIFLVSSPNSGSGPRSYYKKPSGLCAQSDCAYAPSYLRKRYIVRIVERDSPMEKDALTDVFNNSPFPIIS